MATRTVTVQRRPLNFWERIYVPEIIRGVAITGGIFWRNLFLHSLHMIGLARKTPAMVTITFPETTRHIPERHRTRHRLMKLRDGTERCVACMMCETVCPAYCISIVAEERTDGYTEKRPRIFDLDLGKCVYCGSCVEVCPCDAIRMDTKILNLAAHSREEMIYTKADLMAWEERPDGAVVSLAWQDRQDRQGRGDRASNDPASKEGAA